MEESHINEQLQRSQLNSILAHFLIPNDVILCLYLVVGLFGNATVIYIYAFKMKKDRDNRYFIPYLAMVDLLACAFGAGFALSLNLLPFMFRGDVLCKSLWFISEATSISSSLLLLVIAVHRYMKVCTPFEEQMTVMGKRAALIVTVISSCLMSGPTIVFYEEVNVSYHGTNITGYRCFKKQGVMWEKGLFIYDTLLLVCAVAGISGITILYGLIGKTIYRQYKRHRDPKRKKSTTAPRGSETSYCGGDLQNNVADADKEAIHRKESNQSSRTTSPSSPEPPALTIDHVLEENNTKDKPFKDISPKLRPKNVNKRNSIVSQTILAIGGRNNVMKTNSGNSDCFVEHNRLSVQPFEDRRYSKRSSFDILRESFPKIKPERVWDHFRAHKYSYMFMTITLVFVISYIPRMVLMVLESSNPDFWNELSDQEIKIYLFLYRMYILNHVCNPFIYGMYDARFRDKTKRLLCPCLTERTPKNSK